MKLTRLSFLKALGVSPFVARALISDGARAAQLPTYQNICYNEGLACVWAGPCSQTCTDFCAAPERSICNRCQDRPVCPPPVTPTPEEICADPTHRCGSSLGRCTRTCNQFCADPDRASCPICTNRNC